MKALKKILIGVGLFLVILVAAAFIIPVVFKDDIKKAIDKELAKNINADVLFDANNFDLTLFRNFPNITIEIKELGVFNHAPFDGVALFVVDELAVELNLKDVLFGDQLKLKGITLVKPQIDIRVLKDGRANWDVTYPSAETTAVEEEATSFSFEIEYWKIQDGDLIYDDQSIPFAMSLKGLNHTGNGNYNEKLFDLNTKSIADSVTVSYDGVEYVTNKMATIDAVIEISEDYSKYTFK
nr:AsmA family protein [Cyclobacteriaceae bacterium]